MTIFTIQQKLDQRPAQTRVKFYESCPVFPRNSRPDLWKLTRESWKEPKGRMSYYQEDSRSNSLHTPEQQIQGTTNYDWAPAKQTFGSRLRPRKLKQRLSKQCYTTSYRPQTCNVICANYSGSHVRVMTTTRGLLALSREPRVTHTWSWFAVWGAPTWLKWQHVHRTWAGLCFDAIILLRIIEDFLPGMC